MVLTVSELIERLNTLDDKVTFDEVMQVISTYYHYKPSRFTNADLVNDAGTNEGSCKIFAFAKLHHLSEQATLNCFGNYYREEVLKNPHGSDHGNIRRFIENGWAGIDFDNTVLV